MTEEMIWGLVGPCYSTILEYSRPEGGGGRTLSINQENSKMASELGDKGAPKFHGLVGLGRGKPVTSSKTRVKVWAAHGPSQLLAC